MIKKYQVKSCCGKSSHILQLEKSINKSHLQAFIDAGYTAPGSYSKHGVFYVRGHGVTASCSFGTNRISVRCAGSDCPQQIDTFSQILEQVIQHG